jgi:hypothetical protein
MRTGRRVLEHPSPGGAKTVRMRRRMPVASSTFFRPGATPSHFVAAEIGVSRSRRQHEIIVGDPAFIEGATFDDHGAALAVDAGYLAQYDAHIGSPAQDGAMGEAIWAGEKPAVATW